MANIRVVAFHAGVSHITGYPLGGAPGDVIIWHGENYPDFVVEGCIFEVEIIREWTLGCTPCISGPILSQCIDIPALGLPPLKVRECVPKSNEYKMDQVIPGWKPNVFGSDPILDALAYQNQGQENHALEILRGILKQDLRCIDAHVHLGNFSFGEGKSRTSSRIALKHYTLAVEMGNFFLGPSFQGKLPWGWINNRPYLRALYGQCISWWALEEFKEATKVANHILKLNPPDHQGIRALLPELKARIPYDAGKL